MYVVVEQFFHQDEMGQNNVVVYGPFSSKELANKYAASRYGMRGTRGFLVAPLMNPDDYDRHGEPA